MFVFIVMNKQWNHTGYVTIDALRQAGYIWALRKKLTSLCQFHSICMLKNSVPFRLSFRNHGQKKIKNLLDWLYLLNVFRFVIKFNNDADFSKSFPQIPSGSWHWEIGALFEYLEICKNCFSQPIISVAVVAAENQ